mmetsp:Transcript_1248/g.2597  ORF Transcript_1248/g.2597 Transcript_1248/m.2597 type:complete len:119 (-) Transcript_1248:1041-1397(-)
MVMITILIMDQHARMTTLHRTRTLMVNMKTPHTSPDKVSAYGTTQMLCMIMDMHMTITDMHMTITDTHMKFTDTHMTATDMHMTTTDTIKTTTMDTDMLTLGKMHLIQQCLAGKSFLC